MYRPRRVRLAISLIALLTAGLVTTSRPPAATAAVSPTGPTVTVTGTVVDTAGNPVADASVHGARTQQYTKTNGSGGYTLSVPDGTAEIIAAKEGYAFGRAVRAGTGPVTVRLAPQSQALPRAEYPRPDADRRPFTNNAWLSLNGTWSFDFDPTNVGENPQAPWFAPGRAYGKAIQVPFPYQSLAAFGEQQLATSEVFRSAFDSYNGAVWYRRGFTVPAGFAGQNTRLRIGAAYWGYTVWLDGQLVQPYVDYGDTEWVVDLGALAPNSAHTLVIKVIGRVASVNSPFPIGRQDLFANKGGIWQSVWIEPVRTGRLGNPQVIPNVTFTGGSRTPSAASATVNISSTGAPTGTADVVVRDPVGTQVANASVALNNGNGSVQLAIPQPQLWDIKQPNLYTADAVLTNGGVAQDGIRVSFGLRKVERKNAPGTTTYQYIWLNNRPVYIRGALDQGYNPWGTSTPTGDVTGSDFTTGTAADPAPGSIAYDLEQILAQGYNLTRPHVKLFDPLYYYWADKLGLLVWLEMPNPGRQNMFDNNAALFNQFKPRYEGLLRSALAINRNRASVVIWTTFNEGWGVVRPFGDLEQTVAIPFIKSMVALIKQQNPGVLVNDNSACCENGHTSVTDINDVHAGLGGFDNWKAFLDEYSNNVFPGSRWKMSDGGTQSGQPWLMGETTIDRGAQLTNFSMYRSYPKLGGYIVVQYQDQEGEMYSQHGYDRQDRGPEFVDHNGVKRAIDLANGDDAVSIMRDTITTVTPGETLTLPVKLSHFSDVDLSNAQLRWKLAGRDRNGAWVDPGVGGSRAIAPTRYTLTDAGSVSVTVPSSVHSGYVWVWLETPGGQTAAENLLTFTDSTPVPGAFDPNSPTAQSWSGGTGPQEFHCGPQQAIGYGTGYFEYTATVPAAAQNGGTLTFEASSAEAPRPTEHFTNGQLLTEARKFPTGLSVTVDGQSLSAVTLPDDPGDAVGVTSRMFGPYNFPFKSAIGNHYGYRVAVPLSAALLSGKSTVTVRLTSSGGGLRLFGLYAGDHGLPPQIVPGTVPSQVPSPVATVTDRPSVVFTPAQLNTNNTGTAVVSVVNNTNATINGVQTKLHLPPGWSATPVGSADVGTLPPAGHAHVAYTVQAGGSQVYATATAVWSDGGSTVRSVQAIGVQPLRPSPLVISEPAGASQSLSGDGKAEPVCVNPGGTAIAYYNNSAASPMQQWPYAGQAANVGTGMIPGATWFADLDGDGKTEIMGRRPNGDILAWRNVLGFASPPWGGDAVVVAITGTTDPARIHFADLNGDRKSEIIVVEADGRVKAWRNGAGFAPMPWNADTYIATGFTDPARVHFMDLNGDRKAEIAYARTDGIVQAWRNNLGFASMPYAESVEIASGVTEPQRVKFADLNADGRAEIITAEKHGFLRAWRNVAGFAAYPWLESAIIGYGFTRPELLEFA